MNRVAWPALGALLLAVVAGCGGPAPAARDAATAGPPCLPARADGSPAGTSPAGTSPAGTASSAGTASTGAGSAAGPVLDRALSCLDGGHPVRLDRLGVPAVVNLWASWCGPCRQELPAIDAFARSAGDQVLVLGVATRDTGTAARALVADQRLTMPMLIDPDAVVLAMVGRAALPVTVLLDAAGRVAFVYQGPPLDGPALTGLVRAHLGPVVAG